MPKSPNLNIPNEDECKSQQAFQVMRIAHGRQRRPTRRNSVLRRSNFVAQVSYVPLVLLDWLSTFRALVETGVSAALSVCSVFECAKLRP